MLMAPVRGGTPAKLNDACANIERSGCTGPPGGALEGVQAVLSGMNAAQLEANAVGLADECLLTPGEHALIERAAALSISTSVPC